MEKGVQITENKGFKRIFVPLSLRCKLLEKVHDVYGHIGCHKMIEIIYSQYYWPYMSTDTANFVKCCVMCQENKTRDNRIKYEELQELPSATQPFDLLSIDTIGRLNYKGSSKTDSCHYRSPQ